MLYIILSIIQGITEPLPISSSGHLYLISNIFNEEFQRNIGEFRINATELNSNILIHKDELGKFLMKVSNL